MNLIAHPSRVAGRASVPASKSHTIRAAFFAALADGESVVEAPLASADADAALGAVRAFGAEVEAAPEAWRVKGLAGRPRACEIDTANSGTTMRLACGVAALGGGATRLTGDAQVQKRPVGPLLDALTFLGARAQSLEKNGCPPALVAGPLAGGRAELACPTSQFLTSLLIACPLATGDSEILVTELNERPYVEMTLRWLDALGIRYERDADLTRLRVPGGQSYPAFTRRVPADWSSATFFLAAAAVTGGEVELTGLDLDDAQGDKAVLDYLEAMGATVERSSEAIRLRGGALACAHLDLNATPDALPAMAVAAAFAEGETQLANVPQARLKETDRIAVMAAELGKLGVACEELPDGLVVRGRGAGGVAGGRVAGHGDHRVVMALAVAGLAAREAVSVEDAEAMAVTFPDFVERMAALGARLERA